jgi:polysaccharide export outer membrane protein
MKSLTHSTAPWSTLLALILWLCIPFCQAESGDVLGVGDSIRVTVFQNPDLTTEGRLSAEGTIRMPLIGIVGVKGLSSADAASQIAQRFREGQFLRDPQVTVTVLQVRSRQVSVLGQVVRPGRYALDDSNTHLTDVLALAGGIATGGDDAVTVITTRDGQPARITVNLATMYRTADATGNVEINNGDTIFVQRAPVFYIYGEVQRAGAYRLETNLNVMQAVSLGGGITIRGTERGMKILRRIADGSLARIDVRPSDTVQADDVIYVAESLF